MSKDRRRALGIVAIDDSGRMTNGWAVAREGQFSPVAADMERIRGRLV